MAIALDRVDRGDGESHRSGAAPPDRSTSSARPARVHRIACAAVVGLAVGLGHAFDAGDRLVALDRTGLAAATTSSTRLDYVQNPNTFLFRDLTNPIGNFIVQHGIQPLRTFFVETPWPAMLVGLVAIAFLISGLRRAAIAARDARRSIGFVGEWPNAMDTLLAGARRDGADA